MSINFHKNKYLKQIELNEGEKSFFDIKSLTDDNKINLTKIPFSIRVLIENVLRSNHNGISNLEQIEQLINWTEDTVPDKEFPYMPGRVITRFYGSSCCCRSSCYEGCCKHFRY